MPAIYRRGDRGPAVAEIRARLASVGLLPDAGGGEAFDDAVDSAVRQFQQERGITADGVVGPLTYRLLDEARWQLGDRLLGFSPARPVAGDDVLVLQRRLSELGFDIGRTDGVFGVRTEQGLREFQRNTGLPADGTCGPATFKALARLRPLVTGGKAGALRETEGVRRAGPRLPGKAVVLDPGHGGPDRGCSAGGLAEADVVADLALRIEGRLAATGVRALLTRGPDSAEARDEDSRAAFANDTGADLLLSLHCDRSTSPRADGVATFYYGHDRHGAYSAVGEQFAGLVQREILARTDLRDCRSHPKTWDLLRHSRMPAVRLELGYVTSPRDAARLADPGFRDVVAEAVVVAVQRVYLPREDDVPTGALRLRDLASQL
jgi:N-acetylmuramoyl-L-alanine amidase